MTRTGLEGEISSWGLRGHIEGLIKSMPLGHRCRVGYSQVSLAYPHVGPDGSMLGAFQAIALAANGNRPEPIMTPFDRFKTFLAREGYVISFDNPVAELFEIERGREKCGHCRGWGKRQHVDIGPEGPTEGPGDDASATVSWSIQPCQPCGGRGYLPASGDPDARFGDHSASDAWIAAQNRKRTAP